MSVLRIVVLVVVGLAVVAGGVGVAIAPGQGGDDEIPISGEALERASAAALAHVGGGTVTETEIGDEEGYYEVEITKDGREIDVHLDRNFNVISAEEDDGEESEDSSAK